MIILIRYHMMNQVMKEQPNSMSATSYTTKLISNGDLYINLRDHGLIALKYDNPERSEFRMKSGYVFTVIDDECEELTKRFATIPWVVKVLMANTGKLQLVRFVELEGYIHSGLVKRLDNNEVL